MKLLAFVCVLASLAAPPPQADFEKNLQSALGPYYAALVASSHGNIEETQRQVLLFASKWDSFARQSSANVPAALRADSQWSDFLHMVSDKVAQARENCRKRNAAAAHADLESIRLTLREIDSRHNVHSIDDSLTDFHDAMQRMIGHVGGANEIALKPKDFDDIAEDYQAAREAWKGIEAAAGNLQHNEKWRAAHDDISRTLVEIGRELQARQPLPLASTIEGLRDKYYSLLLAVARARS